MQAMVSWFLLAQQKEGASSNPDDTMSKNCLCLWETLSLRATLANPSRRRWIMPSFACVTLWYGIGNVNHLHLAI